jgi:Fimbrial assembly protein (PilN)
MIIRSNLASSPIKNYSIYLIGCLLLGLAGILFTFFNVVSLTSSYSKNSVLKETIIKQNKQLAELQSRAQDLRTKIDRIKTPEFISETEFMNNAIKRRTFSWTTLFDHFEEVLPQTVKMVSVTPVVQDQSIAINMEMAGKSLADMLELVRTLERDPLFSDVVLKGEQQGDDEQVNFSISLNYRPAPQGSRNEL